MHYLRVFWIVLGCCFSLSGFSQTDSNVVVVDSTIRNPDAKRNPIFNAPKDTSANLKVEGKTVVFKDSARLALEQMPKTASRRSAMIPGWGQVTNKRWWKVPIIYGGFVSLGLAVEFNQRYYRKFLKELQFRYEHEGETSDPELVVIKDQQGLLQYKDFYRRNRDLSVLAGLGLYAINIIDAYVDAKFFRFDISDELGLKVTPAVVPMVSHAQVSGVPGIKLQLKL
ncbi:DUF5683 domain-containing protein [Paradesertivirga mongoliensis]|uniref:DUF5683 domain-containing protein n=1 Tax=Paradesertivirga mongoliensis TaxID=2100740 RepID=A0ABW4ZH77_9SPHI|nr:DUF5683 domain-containing protein [Pedobacter mongoliensis]